MTTALIAQPDSAVLDEFIGRMIGDLGATVSAGLVVIGDRLGLYKAMADGEPVTPEQLASRTGTAIAYVRPWLANQAAGGYLGYQPESGTFSLSPEQAAALAIEDSPAFVAGAMQLVLGALRDLEHIEHGFRTGEVAQSLGRSQFVTCSVQRQLKIDPLTARGTQVPSGGRYSIMAAPGTQR
jgi:hypothetical protein